MKRTFRLLATLLLLCLAGLALSLVGCGGSSNKSVINTSQPMDITSGTWTISVTPASGTASSMTVTFSTFACSTTSYIVGAVNGYGGWEIGTGAFSTSAAVCLNGNNLTGTTTGFTPQGLAFGVGANPVSANGTTTMTTVNAFFVSLDSNGNQDLYDLTGTFTASSQSVSGNYTCDSSPGNNCTGDSGTFSGSMK